MSDLPPAELDVLRHTLMPIERGYLVRPAFTHMAVRR
ncbi:UNVERIFIED_ORG: hypothetical protein FHR68_003017 [Xanthomonas campestris]